MACIKPPALTNEQLLTWIDGAATDEVAVHAQQCATCRHRANGLAHWQKQLATQLYRVECPSALELGEYHLALLPMERELVVEKHLTTCLHCAREIQTLQSYLTALAPPVKSNPSSASASETLGQHLHRLVAKLVDPLPGTVADGEATLAFAGTRGETEEPLVYEVADLRIIIEIQIDPRQLDRRVLLGLILGLDTEQTVEAHLEQALQPLMATSVDEGGNFSFTHLAPGTYTILLRSAEREIRVEDLQV